MPMIPEISTGQYGALVSDYKTPFPFIHYMHTYHGVFMLLISPQLISPHLN